MKIPVIWIMYNTLPKWTRTDIAWRFDGFTYRLKFLKQNNSNQPVIQFEYAYPISIIKWRPLFLLRPRSQFFRKRGNTWFRGMVSGNRGAPQSSISMGFSLIKHPFGGTSIYGNPHWTELIQHRHDNHHSTSTVQVWKLIPRKIPSLKTYVFLVKKHLPNIQTLLVKNQSAYHPSVSKLEKKPEIKLFWLVVGPPLWKIWVRQLGW